MVVRVFVRAIGRGYGMIVAAGLCRSQEDRWQVPTRTPPISGRRYWSRSVLPPSGGTVGGETGCRACRPFAITCLFWTLWLLSLAGQAAATDLSSLVAAYRFEGLWRLPATTAIFCFTLEYVQPGRWLTRRNLIILTIPSVIIATLILTDGRFHLIWRRLVVDGMLRPEPALLGWVFLVYGLVLALLQIVALSWLFVRSPQHRWPAGLMLAMLIVARVLFLRDLMQPGASDSIDNVFLALGLLPP